MTTGKAVLLAALFGAVVLVNLHVTVRVSPIGSFAVVDFLDRTVIDFASGAEAIGETPSAPEPSEAVIASTIAI